MMKIKNIIIYFIVLVIIIFSLKMPNLILNRLESNIENIKFEKKENKISIDVEAEKIYLVETIHNIEDKGNIVEISSNKQLLLVKATNKEEMENINIINELNKLNQYKILKKLQINEQNDKYNIGIIDKYYQKDKKIYTIKDITVEIKNKIYNLEIESKTGKILDISTKKENINTENKKELMINYINYLDLNIIDDWNYENNVLRSEKAKLVVNLIENDNQYGLSIHSTERNYNYIDIYEYK